MKEFIKKINRIDLLIFTSLYIIIYLLFRFWYSTIDFTADSGTYVQSAFDGIQNGYRPQGYSWFIKAFSSFGISTTTQFTLQFLLHSVASLLLIFSVKEIVNMKSKWLFYLFGLSVLLTPNTLYVTNYLMSDSVFSTLTILLLVATLWMVHTKKIKYILFGFILFYFLFNVRYLGMFYIPFLIISYFIALKGKKILALGSSVILVVILFGSMNSIEKKIYRTYQVKTYSGFGGWALSNNACAIVPFERIALKEMKFTNPALVDINNFILNEPDSIYDWKSIRATAPIWTKTYPLKKYMFYRMNQIRKPYISSWLETGMLFNEYGQKVILNNKSAYFKYFILPNFKEIFTFFSHSDQRTFTVPDWYKTRFGVQEKEGVLDGNLKDIVPLQKIMHYVLWFISFLFIILYFFIRKKIPKGNIESKIFILSFLFIFFYCGASVVTHPINNFRYMIPIHSFQVLFIILGVKLFLNIRVSKPEDEIIEIKEAIK